MITRFADRMRILRGGTPVGFWEAGAVIAEGDTVLALEAGAA